MNGDPILEQLREQKAAAENTARILGDAIAALEQLNGDAPAVGNGPVLAKRGPGRRPKPHKLAGTHTCGACTRPTRWNPCEHCDAVLVDP